MSRLLWITLLFLLLPMQACLALTCTPPRTPISLYLDHAPKTIFGKQPFSVFVEITNNGNQTQRIDVYSYVYRGSKVYSSDRKHNLQELIIEPGQSVPLELNDSVDALPGEYKLKIRLEYPDNKTKEITETINITSDTFSSGSLEISSLAFDAKPTTKITARINNTFDRAFDIRLILESDYASDERQLTIPPAGLAALEFPVKLQKEKNTFFLKMYTNTTLVDISELIVTNKTISSSSSSQRPFNLIAGNIILNQSRTIYKSSSEKSRDIVVYLFLIASITLNISLILKHPD